MKTIKLPPYTNFPCLTNDKIMLRQVNVSDIDDIIEISFYDSEQATTLQQAIEMQKKINDDYQCGNSIHWGITYKPTNKIIGTCGYYRGFHNWGGELGCVLLPQYCGQGFMTSAMLLAIDFGIKNIGLKRIWAVTSEQNEKAIKLLKRINFEKVRVLDNNEVEFELVSKAKNEK